MSGEIVSSGQVVTISAGESASGYTVLSGGTLYIAGTAVSTTVDAGGYVEVESGGVASATSDFGDQQVDAQGSAVGTIVSGGGLEDVFGLASGTLVESGALQDVEYGGTASGATIGNSGLQAVYGSALDATVESGGFELAEQSEQFILGSNGPEFADVGGVVSGATVDAGGFLVSLPVGVISGATGSGTIASTGVVEVDLSAHSAVYLGETTVGDAAASGAVECVLTSGTATDTNVSSGGEQDVYGRAIGTVISGDPYAYQSQLHIGHQEVESGGAASGALIVGGEQDVLSGGLAVSATINEGLQAVQGGIASGAILSGLGQQDVADGVAISTVVSIGGSQTIEQGASATMALVDGGRQFIQGLAISTTVRAGSEVVGGFAAASATTISGTGTQYVSAYGVASGTVLANGGFQELASGAEDLGGVVGSGGFQLVDQGGAVSSIAVLSGGVEDLYGSAVSTTVESFGLLIVNSGASMNGVTLETGAVAVILPGASGSGASGTSGIVSTGILDVSIDSRTAAYLGSTVTGNLLGSNETEYVLSGALAVSTTLSAGSADDTNQIVYGSAVHTVMNGGEQDVQAGGVSFDTTLSGAVVPAGGGVSEVVSAVQVVSSGGFATGAVINSAAEQYDNGSAAATIIESGGLQDVAGAASDTTINAGGTQLVFGQTDRTTVNSGGFEHIESGAVMTSTTVESGGLVQIAITEAMSGLTAGLASALEVVGGVAVDPGGMVTELDVQAGAAVTSTVVNTGGRQAVYGAASGTVVHSGGSETVWGSASGTVVDAGGSQLVSGGSAVATVVNSGGVADVHGTMGGAVIHGGLLDLEPFAKASGSIDFQGGGALELGDTISFTMSAATVSGFTRGDIDFTSLQFVSGSTSATFSGSTLAVGDGGKTYSITLGSEPAGIQFSTQNDGYGGTEVTPEPQTVCYTPDVLILTDHGEVRAGDLAIGDRVVTLSGEAKPIRWIGRRSYSGKFAARNRQLLPVCIKAGALDDGLPRRDLWISPLHAMFLDNVLVTARDLVNGVSIVRAESIDDVHYLHVELDAHEIIFAEGAPAESFRDADCRHIFQNGCEYTSHIPEDKPPMQSCAPLVGGGETLEAIRSKINARAGLAIDAGPLEGWVDRISGRWLGGWARDPEHPHLSVRLDVLLDGRLVARAVANRYRGDLEALGMGFGQHGFEVEFSKPVAMADRIRITVRRSGDGKPLQVAHNLVAETCRQAV